MSSRLLLVSFDTQRPYRLLLLLVPVNAPSGRRLHRVLNRSRSSARDTSDLTSTRDELADCGGLEPMLAVATDQVVHGVGNVRKGEGDCFHSTRACRSQESHGASSGALLNAPMLSSGEVAVTSAAFDCC